MWAVNSKLRRKVPATWIKPVLEKFGRRFRTAKKGLSIVLVGPRQIHKLNLQCRGKNKPTNVLSFPLDDENCLGEIFLCPEIIQKEAREQDIDQKSYFQYILVHGLLHLIGFDHQSDNQQKKMIKQEKSFLASL